MRILGRSRWHVVAIGLSALFALGSAGCLEEPSTPSEGPPVYSHDGGWIAFWSGSHPKEQIYVARSGATATQVTESEHGVGRVFDWSPDGSRIVFDRNARQWGLSSGLFVVNRDGSGLRRLTNGDDYWPCWAADGETIVFARDTDVYAVDADGTHQRLLVRHTRWPACSPIEPAIAVVDDTSIRVIDLKGRTTHAVTLPDDLDPYAPSWSPDGSRIAFQDLRADIDVVNVDGKGLRKLTKGSVSDQFPSWLPDGRIVFLSDRAGPDDLTPSESSRYYVMESDGTDVQGFEWRPQHS